MPTSRSYWRAKRRQAREFWSARFAAQRAALFCGRSLRTTFFALGVHSLNFTELVPLSGSNFEHG